MSGLGAAWLEALSKQPGEAERPEVEVAVAEEAARKAEDDPLEAHRGTAEQLAAKSAPSACRHWWLLPGQHE